MWTGWDFYEMYLTGSTVKTIHTEMGTAYANMAINVASLNLNDFINLLIQTVLINCIALFRIIQMDFVIIVGLSAIAIGFAEGYSIVAIFSALFKGLSTDIWPSMPSPGMDK